MTLRLVLSCGLLAACSPVAVDPEPGPEVLAGGEAGAAGNGASGGGAAAGDVAGGRGGGTAGGVAGGGTGAAGGDVDGGAGSAGGRAGGSTAGGVAGGGPDDAGTTVDGGACAPVPVAPLCPATGWCWKNPAPVALQLNDVITHGCDAWAAGTGGLLLQRTAQGWVPRPSGVTVSLNGFASTGPSDIWLVGDEGTVLHFDGHAWAVQRANTTTERYAGAWAPRPGLVFIAGAAGLHRLENGVLTTLVAPVNTTFRGITGEGESVLRAVGDELIPNVDRRAVVWRFSGGSWTKETSMTMTTFNRVTRVGQSWFAAGKMNGHGPDSGYIARLAPPNPNLPITQLSTEFTALAARAPTDLLAVGRGFTSSIVRFNGTTYSPVTDAPRGALNGVSVGAADAFAAGTTLGRISGSRYFPESGGDPRDVRTLLVLPNDEVWLSGARRSVAQGPFTDTFTGGALVGTEPVHGTAPNNLWMVAFGVWRFDGTAWTHDATAPAQVRRLRVSASQVWGWGYQGLWIRDQVGPSGQWTQVQGAPTEVDDVWLEPSTPVLIGRDAMGPALWFTNGARFSRNAPPALMPGERLELVRGTGPYWVVTSFDRLFRFDALTWTEVPLPAFTDVTDLVVKQGRVVVTTNGASTSGAIFEWNGSAMVRSNLGVSVGLSAADVDATGRVWVGGSGGTVAVKR
ncbi:MAG: hypothetical protein SFW67_30705 [Myxococcaceae bacterium]|nr:hypothetical protein [Myxococcaceae bacterium]